jgi:hypothetical protein
MEYKVRLKTSIELELRKIFINADPLHKKGKYAQYEFEMTQPSTYYFFKKPKVGLDDFSALWGRSPTIVFYEKDYKPLERMVKSLILKDLPSGDDWGWEWADVTSWHLAIADYTSPISDRKWGLFYTAEGWHHKPSRTKTIKEGFVELSKDFMARLQAELPTKFDTDLEVL